MPKVDGKKFPYTAAGSVAAKQAKTKLRRKSNG
jgi:hypothetical protein